MPSYAVGPQTAALAAITNAWVWEFPDGYCFDVIVRGTTVPGSFVYGGELTPDPNGVLKPMFEVYSDLTVAVVILGLLAPNVIGKVDVTILGQYYSLVRSLPTIPSFHILWMNPLPLVVC